MNVELYKLLDSTKITNYDQSDMGEPGTLYIPPIEVSKNGTGRLWATRPISTFGGGLHRHCREARLEYKAPVSKPQATSIESLTEPGQDSHLGNSNSNPGRNSEPDHNSEPRHGGLIRWIIHEEDAFAFLNDDSI